MLAADPTRTTASPDALGRPPHLLPWAGCAWGGAFRL